MKKLYKILVSLCLILVLGALSVGATEGNTLTVQQTDSSYIENFELVKPKAPNYFIYEPGEGEESHDHLEMVMWTDESVAQLVSEYYNDSTTFYEKYGLSEFNIVMQYDVSLDGEDNWQYTSEWDTYCWQGSYGEGFQTMSLNGDLMDTFEFFWLTYHEGQGSDTFLPYQPAILVEKHKDADDYEWETYYFDTENHSLYIRCRYFIEWTPYDKENDEIGETQYKFSEWSDSAVFGKNSTQVVPEKPSTYEAPVISDLKIIVPGDGWNNYVEYTQTTPESVWLAQIYYLMNPDAGQFDGLETEASINGGAWQSFSTANSGGDWCLSNGVRSANPYDEDVIQEDTNIKLRIRFTGSHGPSEWSNVLEINGGANVTPKPTEEAKPTGEPTGEPGDGQDGNKEPVKEDKCGICGFCPEPLGLCILIWIAIVVVVLVILIIILVSTSKKGKCPRCKTKCGKDDKFCPNCGHRVKK